MTLRSDSGAGPSLTAEQPTPSQDLQQIADVSPLLVWHALRDGRFDYVNPDWCTITGLSQTAASGDGWQRTLHPEDRVRWQAAWNEANNAGLPCELDYRLRQSDNSYRWFQARAEAVRDADGQIAGWVGTARVLDESAPRQPAAPAADQSRGDELAAAMRQQHTVVAVAAHDMKNQLAVIRGSAQLLERHMRRASAPEAERILNGLATIQGSVGRLQRLVEEFLDLSRVQSGEPVEFNQQPTDLVALASASVREYAETTGRDLTVASAARTLIGYWDAARLERVIDNLLSNAIKFSAPDSAIRVNLARDGSGDVAVLVVQDHGVGIPAADLPRIFEPFFRGSNVTQRTVGTGLGLFGARALIEQQGGTLRLESTAGSGTTLTMRLPLAPLPTANAAAPAG
jgi:PAS domain S-box-containing protein